MTSTDGMGVSRLLTAFGLQEADLEANRQGHLSATQHRRLQRHLLIYLIVFALGAAASLGAFLLLLSQDTGTDQQLVVLGVGIGLLGVLIWIGRPLWQRYQDWQAGEVVFVEGKVHAASQVQQYTDYSKERETALDYVFDTRTVRFRTYHVYVGMTGFKVPKRIYAAFWQDEAPHRAYFLPRSMRLLSVERIPDPAADEAEAT